MRRTRIPSLAIAAALLAAGPASANVGVTSATAGDPLGQPPAQQQRVLRVGVDVQAKERVTTGADDRAHLVFLDGTALTVGPNSTIVIDKYVFDPNAKTGEVVLGASKGVFRLVGGSISKTGEIKVNTPSASIGIRGGIATIAVSDTGATTATFLYGKSMTVSGQGQSQVATRGGSQIQIDTGRAPTSPVVIPPRGEVAGAIIERPAAVAIAAPRPAVVAIATPPEIRTVAILQPAVLQAAAPIAPVPTVATIDRALDISQLSPTNSKVPVATLIDNPIRAQGQGGGQVQKTSPGPRLAPPPKIPTIFKPNNPATRGPTQENANKQRAGGQRRAVPRGPPRP